MSTLTGKNVWNECWVVWGVGLNHMYRLSMLMDFFVVCSFVCFTIIII